MVNQNQGMYNAYAPQNMPISAYNPQYATIPQANTPNTNLGAYNIKNDRIWVQGESGAKSYLVAPNSTVELWDSESNVIYLKSADASGLPSIKILDYNVRENLQNGSNTLLNSSNDDFVSLDSFKALQGEIETLKEELNKLKECRCNTHLVDNNSKSTKGGKK